jgi:hypothetical protein
VAGVLSTSCYGPVYFSKLTYGPVCGLVYFRNYKKAPSYPSLRGASALVSWSDKAAHAFWDSRNENEQAEVFKILTEEIQRL